MRTPLYETFYLSHLISGILLGIATVYHLPHTESITYWLSIGALSLLGCIFLLRVAVTISRNVSFNKGASLPLATLQSQTEQMFEISLAMTKQWNFKPGQFIYLRFPFLSREYWLVSWFQSHPFTIVSWDVPAGHSRFLAPTTIRVVAKSRMGLTQILHHISQESKTEKRPLQTIVEGPYGSFSDFSRFDTIFMVATDVGILALISHIRGVLDGLDEYATRTRFVHLIWDLQRHQDVNLAKQYIDALFEHDDKFFVSLLRNVLEPDKRTDHGSPSRSGSSAPTKGVPRTIVSKDMPKRMSVSKRSIPHWEPLNLRKHSTMEEADSS